MARKARQLGTYILIQCDGVGEAPVEGTAYLHFSGRRRAKCRKCPDFYFLRADGAIRFHGKREARRYWTA